MELNWREPRGRARGVRSVRFLAHSLGALAILAALAEGDVEGYESGILLAPAVALRPRARVGGVAAAVLPERLKIPSGTPAEYRLYPSLPVSAYRALFTLHHRFHRCLRDSPLPLKLYAFISVRDEFLSPRRLCTLKENGLPGLETTVVSPRESGKGPGHLCVDRMSMGPVSWNAVERVLEDQKQQRRK